MTVQWLGHACFRISHGGYTVVIDPYNHRFTEGYPELHTTADMLLVSHEHYGHNFREAVKLSGRGSFSCPFNVSSFEVDHDGGGGLLRGRCLVHVLEADGIRVAHMGDIGTQLDGGELSKLMNLDALIVTAGSLTALPSQEIWRMFEELYPRVLIPMHYRDGVRGPRRLETVDALINYFEDPSFAVHYNTDTIEITHDSVPQIAVLKYMGGSTKSNFPKFAGFRHR